MLESSSPQRLIKQPRQRHTHLSVSTVNVCPVNELLGNLDKIYQHLGSLDIFWLRDESLEEFDNLPDPDVLAQEIVDDLKAALEQFREIARFSIAPSLHRKIKKLTNDKCQICFSLSRLPCSISLHFVLIALKRSIQS